MLESAGPTDFTALINGCSCRLELPPDVRTSVLDSRAETFSPVEERRSPRIPILARGAVRVSQSLPAISREGTLVATLVRDVSQRGLRLLYHEQLFPGERLCVWLPDAELVGEVARCRCLGPKCYDVGVQFDEPIEPGMFRQLLRLRRK